MSKRRSFTPQKVKNAEKVRALRERPAGRAPAGRLSGDSQVAGAGVKLRGEAGDQGESAPERQRFAQAVKAAKAAGRVCS